MFTFWKEQDVWFHWPGKKKRILIRCFLKKITARSNFNKRRFSTRRTGKNCADAPCASKPYTVLSFHSLFYTVVFIGQSTVLRGALAHPTSTSAHIKLCLRDLRNAFDVAKEKQILITRRKLIEPSCTA